MVSHLKNIDMFGVAFSFNTFGQAKFKTNLGALMTCMCLAIVSVFIYLFGTDFFHKENPNVIPNFLVHLKSKKIKLKTDKYSFMMRLEYNRNIPVSSEKTPFKIDGSYYHIRKDNKGESKLLVWVGGPDIIKKCSETRATFNKDLTNIKLDEWLCWDFEAVKAKCRAKLKDIEPEYEPFLGGHYDEEEYTALRYDVTNRLFDYETEKTTFIVPDKEFNNLSGDVNINVRFPAVSYDSESHGNPIRTFYDSMFKVVKPINQIRMHNFMSLVTNIDDSGWVFPSRTTTDSMEKDRSEQETNAVSVGENIAKSFYLAKIGSCKFFSSQ